MRRHQARFPVSRRAIEAAADRLVPPFLAAHGEKLQYLAVGAYNTVFGYAVWAALYAALSHRVSYAVILVVSYAISITNAYVWYRLVVFRSHGRVWRELPRFSTVYVATMVINLIFFPIAVARLPFNAYVVQALFLCGVVVASYLAHKHFSFGTGRKRAPAPGATRPKETR